MTSLLKRRIGVPTSRLRWLRLLFWASWAGAMGFPFLTIVAAPFGLGVTNPIAGPTVLIAVIGMCLTSALLVDLQPSLARFGMRSLGIGMILVLVTCGLLGPITN